MVSEKIQQSIKEMSQYCTHDDLMFLAARTKDSSIVEYCQTVEGVTYPSFMNSFEPLTPDEVKAKYSEMFDEPMLDELFLMLSVHRLDSPIIVDLCNTKYGAQTFSDLQTLQEVLKGTSSWSNYQIAYTDKRKFDIKKKSKTTRKSKFPKVRLELLGKSAKIKTPAVLPIVEYKNINILWNGRSNVHKTLQHIYEKRTITVQKIEEFTRDFKQLNKQLLVNFIAKTCNGAYTKFGWKGSYDAVTQTITVLPVGDWDGFVVPAVPTTPVE